MKEGFLNGDLQRTFSKNGFVIVPQFFTKEQVADLLLELESIYEKFRPQSRTFFISTDSLNTPYRQEVRDVINRAVAARVKEFLFGYRLFYSNYLLKKSGNDGTMVLHTDWSITDETIHQPMQIWLPLVDVDGFNGTLAMMEGSHLKTKRFRGPGIEEPYIAFFQGLESKYLRDICCDAGTAVFYHPGILHASKANLSPNSRPAVLISMHPEVMDPVIYTPCRFLLRKRVKVNPVNLNFFDSWNKEDISGLKSIKTIREPLQKFRKQDFLA
ncbi:MAG: phytanoyl-CoA dioxygenase family protein [Chitinophagales bacterium]